MRAFKTRSIATQACKNNKVWINETLVKPSRELKVGEVIDFKKNHIIYSFKVTQFPKGRLGAKLVPEYREDVTKPEELEKLLAINTRLQLSREKGTGRPTKKDRREIDEFQESWDDWDDWDD